MLITMQSLAWTRIYLKKYDEAESMLQDVYITQHKDTPTDMHVDIGKTLHYQGKVLEKMKRYKEARDKYEKALEVKNMDELYPKNSFIRNVTINALKRVQDELEKSN